MFSANKDEGEIELEDEMFATPPAGPTNAKRDRFAHIEEEEQAALTKVATRGDQQIDSANGGRYAFIGATPDSADWLHGRATPTTPSSSKDEKNKERLKLKRHMEAEEVEEREIDDDLPKRFKIVNYTSADSHLTTEDGQAERTLTTYYCSACGTHCLISNVNIAKIPKRQTDGSLALNVSEQTQRGA
eukprot:Selendium_serpulae@DN6503_c0_g1_i8.p1